jgi:adenylate cyclase
VVEAIRCGVEIQNEIAERNASVPEDGRMQFRIGVNTRPSLFCPLTT